MQFYRRLTPIKAISFDLDDTLYNNRPIMQAIEKKMVLYFAKLFDELFAQVLPAESFEHSVECSPNKSTFNRSFWTSFRQQAIKANADISHDVVQLRFESYRLGFIANKLSLTDAEKQAQAALDYFIHLRSDFIVPQVSHNLLASLGKKVPLVAISNGNVNTKALGIEHYFDYIYHAGFQTKDHCGVVGGIPEATLLKQKPSTDMFNVVCNELAILPQELLHVGDCGYADIHGALNAGCQTAWLPLYGVGKTLQQLPHMELSSITQLQRLFNSY